VPLRSMGHNAKPATGARPIPHPLWVSLPAGPEEAIPSGSPSDYASLPRTMAKRDPGTAVTDTRVSFPRRHTPSPARLPFILTSASED
jgi:hypothetical protein